MTFSFVQNNTYLLATFRCHDTSRLEVKVRIVLYAVIDYTCPV